MSLNQISCIIGCYQIGLFIGGIKPSANIAERILAGEVSRYAIRGDAPLCDNSVFSFIYLNILSEKLISILASLKSQKSSLGANFLSEWNCEGSNMRADINTNSSLVEVVENHSYFVSGMSTKLFDLIGYEVIGISNELPVLTPQFNCFPLFTHRGTIFLV